MMVSPAFWCLKRFAADSTAMILTQPAGLSGFIDTPRICIIIHSALQKTG
ncbi:hypothetical protein CKS_3074 [Pantoea stewartii subsp. stewartii DC283]|uniref:Uncharacterized protein n=1 Tax=Pantoea stewartii subsp. stewartii DC283 TaxID=660596 RepID=H3RKG6_PANSE|nr:hypothetical protein CKS_3074 [Pantoea stewartii subsp. stewartii DC283]